VYWLKVIFFLLQEVCRITWHKRGFLLQQLAMLEYASLAKQKICSLSVNEQLFLMLIRMLMYFYLINNLSSSQKTIDKCKMKTLTKKIKNTLFCFSLLFFSLSIIFSCLSLTTVYQKLKKKNIFELTLICFC